MPKRNRFGFVLAAAAGAATAAAVVQFQIEKREAEAKLRWGSTLIETARGPVECAVMGEGPAVLISHGALGGYDQGLALGRPLADAGFTVVAVSRPGYLRTPLSTGPAPEAQADAHNALLDALGIERAAILGASAGGISALHFAIRHPQRCRALILMCAIIHQVPASEMYAVPGARTIMNLLRHDFAVWLGLKAGRFAPLAGMGDPNIRRAAAGGTAQHAMFEGFLNSVFPPSPRWVGVENDLFRIEHLRPAPMESIAAPTLILHGEQDPLASVAHARTAASLIPGAQLITYGGGADHGFFISRYDEVWPQITAFLKTHLAQDPSGS